MKNRILGMAAAMAMLAASSAQGARCTFGDLLNLTRMPGASELGIGRSTPRPPRYSKFGGYGVRQGKRMARKRRNQLRARGQFRKAVR